MRATTTGSKAVTSPLLSPKPHQHHTQARCTSMAPQSQPALHLDSKAIRTYSQRTAAAAPDTLVTEETVQQPSVEFLGVLKDMQTVKGVIHTAAAPDLVFDILTDYDSCSRVFRNISGSQTLFTDAGDKQVIQVCRSCWPARLDGGRLSSGSAVVSATQHMFTRRIYCSRAMLSQVFVWQMQQLSCQRAGWPCCCYQTHQRNHAVRNQHCLLCCLRCAMLCVLHACKWYFLGVKDPLPLTQ
jgi:hypothetical protein